MNAPVQHPMDMAHAFDARLNAGDVDGLLALLAPQAVSRTPQGEVLEDREAIRANFAELVAAGARLENRPRQVLGNGTVALLLIDWTLELTAVDGAPTLTGTTTNVVVQDGETGEWRLAVLNPAGTT